MSQPQPISDIQTQTLLAYVRDCAGASLAGQRVPQPPPLLANTPYGGLFVTLRTPEGRLRGCMGRLCAEGPLGEALLEVTRSSLNDPRFLDRPVTPDELPGLHIEVSILGPLWEAPRPEELQPGVHGVLITRGPQRGCFLPQVAREHGWSIETFLSECCRLKAGLPPDAWRDPATRVEAFEVYAVQDRGGEPRDRSPCGDVV